MIRTAAHVRDDEAGTEAIVLAELEDGTGQRIEIQRPIRAAGQDRALGQDIYCLVTESGATHYCGVTSWRSEGGELLMLLTPEASSALGLDDVVTLHLRLPSPLRMDNRESPRFDAVARGQLIVA